MGVNIHHVIMLIITCMKSNTCYRNDLKSGITDYHSIITSFYHIREKKRVPI